MMGEDNDLVAQQHIVILKESIEKFAQQANEQLFGVADDLNRCKANFTILEKKLNSCQPDFK